MPVEELGQKFFSRERIRNRLLKKAAEIWEFSESEMDDFDPLVSLLMDACSVEFEKVAGEIAKTQNRMLERLAHLLHPALITVRPAYGIVQCRSVEAETMLHPDAQFIYKAGENDRKRDTQPLDLFFSPVFSSKITDGCIKYIASSRELFQMEEKGIQKIPVSSSRQKMIAHQHSLWLGIEWGNEVDSLDGVSFFFNWMNQSDSDAWYQYLQYSQWLLDDKPVQTFAGMSAGAKAEEAEAQLGEEFDAMLRIEREVFDLYNRHYVTISGAKKLSQLKINQKKYPPVFERLFDKNDLGELKDALYWIEIRFHTNMPEEALDNIICGINCVPVFNRKLNKFPYKLQALNILPLETDGSFLSVKKIENSQGNQVKLIPFANPGSMPPETFTLRYGVNRFDERNSYETLVNLQELIKEESSFFASLGEEFLVQNIRELNSLLAKLEDKVKNRNKHQSPYPYLIIRPLREGSIVTIEFWSCNGEVANKVPIGSKMLPYRSSYVDNSHLFFMTSTFGGKDKLNDAEKIDQYRKSLLTRNRIVTPEDLKAVVQAELSKWADSIEYKKKYRNGIRAGEGFMMYMHIIVTPKPNTLNAEEWDYRLRALQLKLEKQSANNIPYHITLAGK